MICVFHCFSSAPGALLGEAAYLPSMVQQQGRPEVFHDPREWYAQAQAKSVPLGFYFLHPFATCHTHSGRVLTHFRPFQFVLLSWKVFGMPWSAWYPSQGRNLAEIIEELKNVFLLLHFLASLQGNSKRDL